MPYIAPTTDTSEQRRPERLATIARLNDTLRCGGGRSSHDLVVSTNGVNDLLDRGTAILDQLFARAKLFTALAAWRPAVEGTGGERDYGSFMFENTQLLFKIDYYDRHDMRLGSEDPSKPHLTCRVLTVMLPSEY